MKSAFIVSDIQSNIYAVFSSKSKANDFVTYMEKRCPHIGGLFIRQWEVDPTHYPDWIVDFHAKEV